MNNRTHINEELQSIAPTLLRVPVRMPFKLPEDYFTQVTPTLLQLIRQEDLISSLSVLAIESKLMPYTLPHNYFQQFSTFILEKVKSLPSSENETALSFLNSSSTQNPYQVPADYFDTLPTTLLQKVIKASKPTVPADYFERLPDQMLAKVRQLDILNETEAIAPLLNSIPKQPVQYVPKDYFDHLEPVTQQQKRIQPAHIVPLKKNNKIWQYAAAACIVLLMGTGIYRYLSNSHVAPSIVNQPSIAVINNELAAIDASVIEQYLQSYSSSLESHTVHYSNVQINDLDDLMLEEFSDQQLQKSLEETPELPSIIKPQKI